MARGTENVSNIEAAHLMNEVQHRRRWTVVQKLQVAQEASVPGVTVTFVARKYGMAPSQLFRWRKSLLKVGHEIVSARDQAYHHGELLELKRRVRELERLLGKATLENEILRETLALGNSKRRPGKDLLPLTDYYR
jgi:transposase